MKKQKALFLMCHWLGDSFWAMQVIPKIRQLMPYLELWVGIKPHSKDLLYGLVDDNKIIVLKNIISDKNREKVDFLEYFLELKTVRKEKFDIAVDLTCNRYSALFLALSSAKKTFALNDHKLSFLYSNVGTGFDYSKHLINKPFETVKLLNDKINSECIEVIPAQSSIGYSELSKHVPFDLRKDRIAMISPGAGWDAKKWKASNYTALGKVLIKHGFKVVVTGSKSELQLCGQISQGICGAVSFNLNLKYFISLIEYIDLAICNDNGVGHLIGAANKVLISIFCGETDPVKCAPIGKKVTIIECNNNDYGKVLNEFNKIYSYN